MCGFVGFTGEIENRDKKSLDPAMADRIAHRGPDPGLPHERPRENAPSPLGFRRLSIIDLADGASRCLQRDGTVVVCSRRRYTISRSFAPRLFRGDVFRPMRHGGARSGTQVRRNRLRARLRGMSFLRLSPTCARDALRARDYFGSSRSITRAGGRRAFFSASEIKSFLEHPPPPRVNPDALRRT